MQGHPPRTSCASSSGPDLRPCCPPRERNSICRAMCRPLAHTYCLAPGKSSTICGARKIKYHLQRPQKKAHRFRPSSISSYPFMTRSCTGSGCGASLKRRWASPRARRRTDRLAMSNPSSWLKMRPPSASWCAAAWSGSRSKGLAGERGAWRRFPELRRTWCWVGMV